MWFADRCADGRAAAVKANAGPAVEHPFGVGAVLVDRNELVVEQAFPLKGLCVTTMPAQGLLGQNTSCTAAGVCFRGLAA